MTVSEKPISPVTYRTPKDKGLPVGYLVIDPLGANYKEYKRIADLSNYPIQYPLYLQFLDFEYGIQDNVIHNYDDVAPYMRSERHKFYSGSQNVQLEVMVRFFSTWNAKAEVHASYEYLLALQYPWIDPQGGYKYVPPKLIFVANWSIRRTGYITAMNTTWFNPVGYEQEVYMTPSTKYGERQYAVVNFYAEMLLTFTVVGSTVYNGSFRDIPSANTKFDNYNRALPNLATMPYPYATPPGYHS